MKELLSETFDDDNMKINTEGVALVIEVAKCLVKETCQQASSCAGHTHEGGMTQVEKCLTQTVNSKIKIAILFYTFLFLNFFLIAFGRETNGRNSTRSILVKTLLMICEIILKLRKKRTASY